MFQCWCESRGGFSRTKSLCAASTCRKTSILLTRQLWLQPRQIQTEHLSSERKAGCVEKRGKGSAQLSKANRKASLPQVQLLYVSQWGMIRRKAGSLSGRYDEDTLFRLLANASFRSPAWPGGDKPVRAAKL